VKVGSDQIEHRSFIFYLSKKDTISLKNQLPNFSMENADDNFYSSLVTGVEEN
jgi:hypothetical protein